MWIQRLFLATIIVLLIQGWIYKRWAMKNLSYQRSFSMPAVFEGDEIQMVERVANEKVLPVPWLKVETRISQYLRLQSQVNFNIKHGEYYKSLFCLMPYMQITRRHNVQCIKRGYYNLKTAALTCGDLFGCTDVQRKTLEKDSELLVYPRLLPLDEIYLPSHSWQGDVIVRRWIVEDPFIISGVREYRYGDSINKINWKATAKAGRFQVHKYDFTADSRLMIYLNVDTSEDQWSYTKNSQYIEDGISYAASIAQHAISNGFETGFGSNGFLTGDESKEKVRVMPRCSNPHLINLFEVLAKLVILRSISFDTFLEEEANMEVTNTDMLIITSYVSEKMEEQIDRLKRLGNAVEILWLEKEKED